LNLSRGGLDLTSHQQGGKIERRHRNAIDDQGGDEHRAVVDDVYGPVGGADDEIAALDGHVVQGHARR
jgi:hypothetical protein